MLFIAVIGLMFSYLIYRMEWQSRAENQILGRLKTESITVGTSWTSSIGPWVSCDILSDAGSSDVYIRLLDSESGTLADNPWALNEAPLKAGENLPIKLGARKYITRETLTTKGVIKETIPESPEIWMICESGTATIRLFKLV